MRRIPRDPPPFVLLAFAVALVSASAGCAARRDSSAAAPSVATPLASPSPRAILGIEEPSGVVRSGGHLFVVGDDEHGYVFDVPLALEETLAVGAPRLVPLDPARLRRIPLATGREAYDLEGVGVLADGRLVALSEGRQSLFDEGGAVALYGHSLGEFAGRGLEGLAVRPLGHDSSRVAVLWEGGYPEMEGIPRPLRERNAEHSLRPFVFVHDLAAGERSKYVRETTEAPAVELRVPEPVGAEPAAQRFRAPDLVWHSWRKDGTTEWGFIVLLSSGSGSAPLPGSPEECGKSEAGVPRRYCYKWLQRFSTRGDPVGDPFDLDTVFPGELATANWEGLGWYEPGKSLVLVYDESIEDRRLDPQRALVIPLPVGW